MTESTGVDRMRVFCMLSSNHTSLELVDNPCSNSSQVISEIIETCKAHDFTDVILVHEHRGVPDGMIISHLPFGPTAYFGLLNVVSNLPTCIHFFKPFCSPRHVDPPIFCRLQDTISRTKRLLEQCLRLTHI